MDKFLPKNRPRKKKKKEEAEIIVDFKFDDYEPVTNKYQPSYRKQKGAIFYDNVDILDQSRFRFILHIEEQIKLEDTKKPGIPGSKSTFTPHTTNYMKYSFQINSNLKWEDINTVVYFSVDIYSCPICLDKKLVAPVITRCGHIMCWPCLLSYYNYWAKHKTSKTIPKCTLCKNKLNLGELKHCEILQCVSYVDSNTYNSVSKNTSNSNSNSNLNNTNNNGNFQTTSNYINLNLIIKNKKSPVLYNTYYDPELEYYNESIANFSPSNNFIPLESDEKYSFSRIFVTNSDLLLNRYYKIKEEISNNLKDELSSEADERRITSLTDCIEIITGKIERLEKLNNNLRKDSGSSNSSPMIGSNNSKNNSVNFNEDITTVCDENEINQNERELSLISGKASNRVPTDYSKFLCFYQEQNGDIYYLHPIDYMILMHEYNNEEELPTEINVSFIFN